MTLDERLNARNAIGDLDADRRPTDNPPAMRSYRYTAIETVVRSLEAVWENARVLVWHVVAHEAKLIVTGNSRTSDMEAALAVWRTQWRQIEAGGTIRQADAVYHPVCTQGRECIGFVQGVGGSCGTPEPAEVRAYVDSRLQALAAAMVAGTRDDETDVRKETPRTSAVMTVRADADREEIERAKTVAALMRNDWNVAAAGRSLGIARQSVSRRMTRMTIQRPSPSPYDPRQRRKVTDKAR